MTETKSGFAMKLNCPFLYIVFILLLIGAIPAQAQLRSEVPSPYIIKSPTVVQVDNHNNSRSMFGLASFRMAHSYEMTMGSFGGEMYNRNMYTNTMFMDFNERLTGRVDIAFAHSPFGNMAPGLDQGAQIYLRNAELNYALSDRSNIRVQFQHIPRGAMPMGYYGMPGGYGYSPYGYGGYFPRRFNPYNHDF